MSHSADNTHTNALIHATSPYLLQHAHNPVDWHEWGPEALECAKRENKPIFLSIGYSACHWCHVMAHESFEDEQTAAILNRNFVNIKVDREERPDLDEIYMQATMMLNNGQGGWPMSVWLTPDLRPFFAGTYFPPEARWGRPGFGELCERIGQIWRERTGDIEKDAEQITRAVTDRLRPRRPATSIAIELETIDAIVDQLTNAFDANRGGLLSGSNKFPPSMTLDLMMRSATRPADNPTRRDEIMQRVHLTLKSMANGGIRDHLAGGFCRYSTDPDWHIPHFEKMLYDQALISRCYVNAYLMTGDTLYAQVARETYDYVLADLQSPTGGFYSARDADSDGEEGKFYVWTRGEIMSALGEKDGALFCDYYDV
ncbi:MAG: thioredoxin domain-containing protein, partial [Phycisphaerales bacterium]|nr:thioredoxin domain-containing protein [Phycisphaerales bacterium]